MKETRLMPLRYVTWALLGFAPIPPFLAAMLVAFGG